MNPSKAIFQAGLQLISLVYEDGMTLEQGLAKVGESLTPGQLAEVKAEWDSVTAGVAATDWDGDDYVAQEFRALCTQVSK